MACPPEALSSSISPFLHVYQAHVALYTMIINGTTTNWDEPKAIPLNPYSAKKKSQGEANNKIGESSNAKLAFLLNSLTSGTAPDWVSKLGNNLFLMAFLSGSVDNEYMNPHKPEEIPKPITSIITNMPLVV